MRKKCLETPTLFSPSLKSRHPRGLLEKLDDDLIRRTSSRDASSSCKLWWPTTNTLAGKPPKGKTPMEAAQLHRCSHQEAAQHAKALRSPGEVRGPAAVPYSAQPTKSPRLERGNNVSTEATKCQYRDCRSEGACSSRGVICGKRALKTNAHWEERDSRVTPAR